MKPIFEMSFFDEIGGVISISSKTPLSISTDFSKYLSTLEKYNILYVDAQNRDIRIFISNGECLVLKMPINMAYSDIVTDLPMNFFQRPIPFNFDLINFENRFLPKLSPKDSFKILILDLSLSRKDFVHFIVRMFGDESHTVDCEVYNYKIKDIVDVPSVHEKLNLINKYRNLFV